MGILNDLAMGFGTKDRDLEYYERTAATMGRPSQGGSPERQAMYRSQMGLDDGATVDNGRLSQNSLLGKAVNAIGGKGGGKVEAPDVRKYEEGMYSQPYNPDGTLADDSNGSLFQVFNNMPYSTQSTRFGYNGSSAQKTDLLRLYPKTLSPLYALFKEKILPEIRLNAQKAGVDLTEDRIDEQFDLFENYQKQNMYPYGRR
jgi:hypothetical protein